MCIQQQCSHNTSCVVLYVGVCVSMVWCVLHMLLFLLLLLPLNVCFCLLPFFSDKCLFFNKPLILFYFFVLFLFFSSSQKFSDEL